jgi:N-acetylglucosaminyldiphosphoundecaprenol N-acetyl-beta-D-mannosaminyltransferase
VTVAPTANAAPAERQSPDRLMRSRVLDTDCFVGNLDSAVNAVIRRALSGEGGRACFGNAHVLVMAERNKSLRNALQSAWAVFPDGSPVAWLQRRAGFAAAQRVPGPDLMPAVMDRGRQSELRHFLFGSTQAVLDAVEMRLMHQYPGVEIVGTAAPRPGEENLTEVLDQITASEPHLVWIALGAPKQELWAQRHGNRLNPSLLMGVGAAFDFIAESKPRAPKWMQASGLEWLHRLSTEPRRLGWRYLSTNSLFLLRAVREISYR